MCVCNGFGIWVHFLLLLPMQSLNTCVLVEFGGCYFLWVFAKGSKLEIVVT
jgi:hypothetical protein